MNHPAHEAACRSPRVGRNAPAARPFCSGSTTGSGVCCAPGACVLDIPDPLWEYVRTAVARAGAQGGTAVLLADPAPLEARAARPYTRCWGGAGFFERPTCSCSGCGPDSRRPPPTIRPTTRARDAVSPQPGAPTAVIAPGTAIHQGEHA